MAEKNDQRKLGQILVEQGIITQKQLDGVIEEQRVTGRFLGEILVSRGIVSEERVVQCLSEQLGFAFVDLANIVVEPKAVEIVPEELCQKYVMMPLFIAQNTLTLAMANPLDVKAVDEVQTVSNYRVKPVFACPTAIRNAIEKYYHHEVQEAAEMGQISFGYTEGQPQLKGENHIPEEQVASLRQAASLAPVINMVNNIITRAVEMGASDIHLEPERKSFNCRYRIHGVLYAISQIPHEEQAAVISRIKIMANMDIAEKRLPQDGRLHIFVAGRDVDFRVSTFPSIYGENLVIRILDRSRGILKLEQLGFTEDILKAFSELIQKPYGMFLVTGPTGSGKTTTLYAALSQLNSLEKNIITLEDPVEYEIAHIRQSQVNVKAGLTFATGLRSIVRQDPDIIMIGEIRDKETADIAIHAALTGHLVFSTLHTNDAPSAATRLIDMGVEPFLVASSVIGILAQRLVRTLCPSCKKSYAPSKELIKELKLDKSIGAEQLDNFYRGKKAVFYKESACHKCKQRGFIGRTGIFELLMPNEHIKDLISHKASSTSLREEAVKAGMQTLRGTGFKKVVSGLTSVSELLRVTEET